MGAIDSRRKPIGSELPIGGALPASSSRSAHEPLFGWPAMSVPDGPCRALESETNCPYASSKRKSAASPRVSGNMRRNIPAGISCGERASVQMRSSSIQPANAWPVSYFEAPITSHGSRAPAFAMPRSGYERSVRDVFAGLVTSTTPST